MNDSMEVRPSTSEVEDRLLAEGIPVKTIETVSSRPSRFEVVYEVTTETGGTRYIRTLNAERAELFQSFLSAEAAIDMPDSELVDGTPPLLVMMPAMGSPLSIVLPLFLLPGRWSWKRTELKSGIRSFGSNLGTLHSVTHAKDAPYGESGIDREKIQTILSDLDQLGFGSSITRFISDTLTKLLHTEVVHTMTHRDPSPHNVYYKSGNVELIDIDLSVRPAIVDVALADIGLRLMAARLPYGRRSQQTLLVDSFWEGYESFGISMTPTDKRFTATRICQLNELLRNYLTRNQSSPVSRLTAFTDRSIIRSLVRNDCENLRDSSSEGIGWES